MVALPSLIHAVTAASAASSFMNPFALLGLTNCDVSDKADQIGLPPYQDRLVLPANSPPKFVGLAFGVQNYTCSPANNFTSTGAVAQLIDTSCFAGSSKFAELPDTLYEAWTNFNEASIQDIITEHFLSNNTEILAQHYFIPNPVTGQGISPKWDFTSEETFLGNKDAFVTVKGKGVLPAPTDPVKDIAWLEVVKIEGEIADTVFRTDTRGGQPPSSCVHGKDKDISVKYVSNYWFIGGSLGQYLPMGHW